MAMSETAKLMAELDINTDKFVKGIANATKSMGFFGHAASTALGIGLQKVASAGLSALGNAIGGGIESLGALEDATTAVDAAIAAVGDTGKVTSGQIADWANTIESNIHAAFDDKDITKAAATLLRFGNVTVDNLQPALVVMTDLAAKTGDIDSAANLLAKALADPTKAAGKLAKQGIILTKVEQDQIAAFVKAGKIGQAQGLILDILSKKTKGAADATQGPLHKAISTFRDVVEDTQRALAVGFLPLLIRIADFLKTNLARPEVIASLQNFGKALAKLFDKGLDFAQKIPWGVIASSLKIAASAANSILDAFLKMPKWVQTAIITGAIAKIAVGAIPGVGVGGGGGGGDGGGGIEGKIAEGIAGGLAHAVGGEILSLLGATSFAGAVTAGLTAAAPFAALAAAAAAIPLAVMKLNEISDPTHERELQGRVDIARARGIPDWNNKALQELNAIKNGVNGGFEALPGKLADDLVPLLPKTAEVAAAILAGGAKRDAEISAAIQALIPSGKKQDDTAVAETIREIFNPANFNPTVRLDPSQITDLRKDTTGNVAGNARDQETSAAIRALIVNLDTRHDAARRDVETSQSIQDLIAQNVDSLSTVTNDGLASVDTSVVQGAANTTNASRMAGIAAASAAYGAGAGIEGAIRANRPIINVDVQISATDITQVNVVEDRGGSRSGSRDGDGGGGPGQ